MPQGQVPLYAGFWRRVAAFLIDSFVFGLVWMVGLQLLLGPQALMLYEATDLPLQNRLLVLENLLLFLATVGFWVLAGATPGKFLTGCEIRCVATGRRPGPLRAALRYVAYLLSILPLGLGFFWIVWDRRKQGWHDKIAGTVVVVDDVSAMTLEQLCAYLGVDRSLAP
jgi:uncharacterized RDD family membrane protein YckC